jgi:hypothetical protein
LKHFPWLDINARGSEMSPTNKDRNIRSETGKGFPISTGGRLGAAAFASAIATALRSDFGEDRSAVKTIASLTLANERAVKNWFNGINGPSGEFLLLLCRHSDSVLETFLMLSGHGDLVKVKKFGDVKTKLNEMLFAPG